MHNALNKCSKFNFYLDNVFKYENLYLHNLYFIDDI